MKQLFSEKQIQRAAEKLLSCGVICPLCNNPVQKSLTKELRNGKGRVLHCTRCDFGILEKQIANPVKYYDKEYRKTHRNTPDEKTPADIFNNLKDFQASRLEVVHKYDLWPGNFLEYGCSAGQFLHHLKGKHVLYGQEYDKKCVEYCKHRFGIKFMSPTEKRYKEVTRCYDYAAMFQTLEHVTDPIFTLSSAKSLLKSGGHLFLEVPNLKDSLLSVWKNPFYRKFFFHEAHNWYFTEKSLRILAEKTGFEVVEVAYTQDYTFFNHIFWTLSGMGQNHTKLGMSIPQINSTSNVAEEINEMLEYCHTWYAEILERYKATSNILMVLRKK